MDIDISLLHQAMKSYDLDPDTLTVESKLPGIYHSDHHYKIQIRSLESIWLNFV
jgi:hypothetical protein